MSRLTSIIAATYLEKRQDFVNYYPLGLPREKVKTQEARLM